MRIVSWCEVWEIVPGCSGAPHMGEYKGVLYAMAPLSSVWKQDGPLDWNFRQLEHLV